MTDIAEHIRQLKRRCQKPIDGVYLEPRQHPKLEDKLCRAFAKAWRRIPLGPRRKMRRHWRTPPPHLILSPFVTVESWHGRGKALGICCGNGHRLKFAPVAVRRYDDSTLQDLVAHELAHVMQYSAGWRDDTDTTLPRWADLKEVDADEMIEDWGFDPYSVDAIAERN